MSTTSTSAATPMTFRPPTQWKPNAPKRKQGTKPRRKDFSSVNSNPETGVSFCVPFAFRNVGPKRTFAIFRNPYVEIEHADASGVGDELMGEISFGFIERIDIKWRRDGNKCLFIHFAPGRWNDNENTRMILDAMKAGKVLRVYTDDKKHFWKTIISKSQRPADYFEDDDSETGVPGEAVGGSAAASTNGETLDSNNEQYLNIM